MRLHLYQILGCLGGWGWSVLAGGGWRGLSAGACSPVFSWGECGFCARALHGSCCSLVGLATSGCT